MQFPVPQFTDVEDRIIGPLTIKQFGIVFAAGAFIFLLYSATKSIPILIFLCLIIGIPALAFAFVPFNGRPIYKNVGPLLRFFTDPRLMVFHKEVQSTGGAIKLKDAKLESEVNKETTTTPVKKPTLKETQKLLADIAAKQKEMLDRKQY